MLEMIFGESNYAVDDQGNRILLGLTVEETREFLELTDAFASARTGQPLWDVGWTKPEEMRWLELMGKHTTELSKMLLAPKH
jgi:hypothetical protein